MHINWLNELHYFWQYNIASFGGNDIKVSNVVLTTLAIFLVSKFYSQITNSLTSKVIVTENNNAKALLERLIKTVIAIIFFIAVLEVANVPLHSLAFLGGTLALGFGLGTQHIINNMISSFILMVETPLSIGDLVTINDCTGVVEEIGHRCVVLRQSSNATVFIPSSVFLQNQFINWTRNKSLAYKTKVKLPKYELENINLDHIVAILDAALTHKEVLSHKVSLSAVTEDYIYILEYTVAIKTKMSHVSHFKNELANDLIAKLGPKITLEHL